MNQFDLVSSVGGTLGLFIGLSFFTLVEMIEIIFELVGNYFATKFRKTPVIPIVNKYANKKCSVLKTTEKQNDEVKKKGNLIIK